MLTSGSHALLGDGPYRLVQINFSPTRSTHLPRTGCRDDGELQCSRDHAELPAKFDHECADIRGVQRRVVFDFGRLARRGQNLVEVSAPARRVVPAAVAPGAGIVQHVFNPSTQA